MIYLSWGNGGSKQMGTKEKLFSEKINISIEEELLVLNILIVFVNSKAQRKILIILFMTLFNT